MRTGYKILIRKPENGSPLAKPRHARGDNIKMNLKKTVNILTETFYFLRKPLPHGISKLVSESVTSS
jgi:hypothetical protein